MRDSFPPIHALRQAPAHAMALTLVENSAKTVSPLRAFAALNAPVTNSVSGAPGEAEEGVR